MKRSLVVLLTIAVLLFAFAGVAMANEEASASKLEALGIIEGYPDGTLGLERNITRAEFAKIAVVLAGLESAADLLRDTPSQFSDVQTSVWYTGWINLAASQGFVKGDPAGTFRPNDNITYSEVLTVLLRILGYNDNLPGAWPTNYIAKAAQLGVTSGVSFDAKSVAVRGKVFVLADKTLDQDVVQWKAADGVFEDKHNPVKTLLEVSFDGSISKEVFVTDWSYDASRKEFTLEFTRIEKDGDDNAWTTGSVKVAKSAVVSGAKSIPDLSGKIAIYVTNDDDEAVSIIVKDYGTVVDDTLIRFSASRVETDGDGKRYTLADETNYIATGGFSKAGFTVGTEVSADRFVLVLNKKGEVVAIRQLDFPNFAILDEVTAAKRVVYKDNFGTNPRITDQLTDSVDYMIIKGGAIVGLEDLKEYDTLRVSKNSKGLTWLIYVNSEKVTGELESVEVDASGKVTKVKVDGKNYTVKNKDAVSFSTDGDSFTAIGTASDVLDAYYGEEVTLILNGLGKVGAIIGDEAGTSGWMYGVVKSWSLDYKGGGASSTPGIGKDKISAITVLTENGSKRYSVTSDSANAARNVDETSVPISFDKGTFVKFNLDADGAIKNFEEITDSFSVGARDKDTWQVRVGATNTWYTVTGSTVIFDIYETDADDWQVVNRADGWNAIVVGQTIYVKVSGSQEIEYLVTRQPAASSDNFAAVMGKGVNKDGRFITLNDGASKVYNTVADFDINGDAYNDIKKSQIVKFDLSGSKLNSATILIDENGFEVDSSAYGKQTVSSVVYQYEVTRVNKSLNTVQIKLMDPDGNEHGTFNLVVDKDTVFFDVSGSNPAYVSLDDIFVGDVVAFGIADNNIISWIAILE